MDLHDIEGVIVNVMETHECHTAILYGSWARGQASPESDVDVLYVRKAGPVRRDARVLHGIHLDAFIYPEANLVTPEPALLRAVGGRVIREANAFGTNLLATLQDLHDRGPTPMADDMRRATVTWLYKMLDRFRGRSNLEAQYRRAQLLLQSLEDYFALRARWFRGPREALEWLRQHDAVTYQRFEHAAQATATDAAFAELVQAVCGPLDERGNDHTRTVPRPQEAG